RADALDGDAQRAVPRAQRELEAVEVAFADRDARLARTSRTVRHIDERRTGTETRELEREVRAHARPATAAIGAEGHDDEPRSVGGAGDAAAQRDAGPHRRLHFERARPLADDERTEH